MTYPSKVAIHPIIGVVDCVNNILFLLNYGTGSYPPFEKGLQRRIRHAANNPPFNTPCFSIASIAYCEQVGVYIQVALPLRADRQIFLIKSYYFNKNNFHSKSSSSNNK